MVDDPFAVLGLTRAASLEDVRSARRRLAFDRHPDRGGDAEAMRELNRAFDAAVAHLTGRRPLPDADPRPRTGPTTRQSAEPPTGPGRRTREGWDPRGPLRVQHDMPSFVIEALPAEAFEALLVVAAWIGEVLVDDPPYLLEVHLNEPAPCWCRLDLVPDAGSSTVSLTVAPVEVEGAPSIESVRDVWVANLNRLGEA